MHTGPPVVMLHDPHSTSLDPWLSFSMHPLSDPPTEIDIDPVHTNVFPIESAIKEGNE